MRRPSIRLLTLLTLLVGVAGESLAGPITVPPGLNPGDQYRLVFRTSTLTDATSSDIADYNAFVAAVAASVPALSALGTTWTAIASTASVDARDNTGTNPTAAVGVAVYQLDGTLIFVDNADMWDGLATLSLDVNETNTSMKTTGGAWTGTAGDGTAGSALGTATPTVGGTLASKIASDNWIDSGPSPQTDLFHVYAISDVLSVVPEPGTIVLVLLGLVGYAASGRRFP